MMQVSGLCKSYGRTVAVASVTFQAPNGMVTGLLGPNGAGKTTTLRALAGLIAPDSGQAFVDGCDVAMRPRLARERLGVLPETVGLYERLTACEHIRYAGALHGLAAELIRRRTLVLTEQLDLGAIANRQAGALSFGQRRRVAFARALVHDPQNVILDEPTNGLDVLGTRQVRRAIRRLADDGRAVILSSHAMPEVSAVCDRIVILARGRVVADAVPAGILALSGRDTLEEAFVRLIGSEEGLN